MKRLHYIWLASALALSLPVASLVATAQETASDSETVVTEADNGGAVTLEAGEVLVVRLRENPSTGYSRAVVSFPNMPVRQTSYRMLPKAPASVDGVPMVGASRVSEWRFVVAGESAAGRAAWLKMLHLRPFAKGVETAGLWEIKVTVPPSSDE